MSDSLIAAGVPLPDFEIGQVDLPQGGTASVRCSMPTYRFFLSLWNRTGAAQGVNAATLQDQVVENTTTISELGTGGNDFDSVFAPIPAAVVGSVGLVQPVLADVPTATQAKLALPVLADPMVPQPPAAQRALLAMMLGA